MLGSILSYVWPAVLAGAVLAMALAWPIQIGLARRALQARLDRAERVRERHAGRDAAQRELADRAQALRADEDALVDREGVAAARQAQRAAESARDAALAEAREYEDQAVDAERRRRKLSRVVEA